MKKISGGKVLDEASRDPLSLGTFSFRKVNALFSVPPNCGVWMIFQKGYGIRRSLNLVTEARRERVAR